MKKLFCTILVLMLSSPILASKAPTTLGVGVAFPTGFSGLIYTWFPCVEATFPGAVSTGLMVGLATSPFSIFLPVQLSIGVNIPIELATDKVFIRCSGLLVLAYERIDLFYTTATVSSTFGFEFGVDYLPNKANFIRLTYNTLPVWRFSSIRLSAGQYWE